MMMKTLISSISVSIIFSRFSYFIQIYQFNLRAHIDTFTCIFALAYNYRFGLNFWLDLMHIVFGKWTNESKFQCKKLLSKLVRFQIVLLTYKKVATYIAGGDDAEDDDDDDTETSDDDDEAEDGMAFFVFVYFWSKKTLWSLKFHLKSLNFMVYSFQMTSISLI